MRRDGERCYRGLAGTGAFGGGANERRAQRARARDDAPPRSWGILWVYGQWRRDGGDKPRFPLPCADHGVAAARPAVSAFPPPPVAAEGGARPPAGTARRRARPPGLELIDAALSGGTADFTARPAMSATTCAAAEAVGVVARLVVTHGSSVVALGEVGIGSATSAAAVLAALTATPLAAAVGRVDDAGLVATVAAVTAGLDALKSSATGPEWSHRRWSGQPPPTAVGRPPRRPRRIGRRCPAGASPPTTAAR